MILRNSLKTFAACTCLFLVLSAIAARAVEPYGCMLIVDGLRGDMARKMAERGVMPNLKAFFLDRGLWVERATSVIPTITGAALPAIVTGAYPGRHRLMSLTFFDRSNERWYDLYTVVDGLKFNRLLDTKRTRTIFEYFPGKDDTWSFGLQSNRGADSYVSSVWSLGYKPLVYRVRFALAMRKLKQLFLGSKAPRLCVAYNGWFDHMEHELGVDNEQMIEHYAGVDWVLGKTMEMYQQAGIFDNTYFVLVSDHGQCEFDKRRDVWQHFKENFDFPVAMPKWIDIPFVSINWKLVQPSSYDNYALVITGGEAKAFMYLPSVDAGRADWSHGPSFAQLRAYPTVGGEVDLIEAVTSWEACDLCAVRDRSTGFVHVFGPAGAHGIIERQVTGCGEKYRYVVPEGVCDPLGYVEYSVTTEMVMRGTDTSSFEKLFTGDEWYAASLKSFRPDGLVQLMQAFDDAQRAPDIYISGRPGYCLTEGGATASRHGALTSEEMWSTLAIAGPGLPSKVVSHARIVDAVPTLLHCMGVGVDPRFHDGRVIREAQEALPGPTTLSEPQLSDVDPSLQEASQLLEEVAALSDELLMHLSEGDSFGPEQVQSLCAIVTSLPPEGKAQITFVIQRIAASLDDGELAQALLSSLQ